MVSLLSKLFGQKDDTAAQAANDTETVRRITRELDLLDADEARYLAAFAFVLARVANSDMEISEDESRRMEEVVRDVGELTEAQALLVVHSLAGAGDAGDATESAFYDARVMEIPTPRWTAHDAKRFGVEPLPGTRMTIQERACTSPIWYTP